MRNSKTVIIKTDDYDVFGDGSVVIKWAAGHTPGHQMLFVKLAKTGPMLLSAMLVGDQTTPVTWQVANEPNAVPPSPL